MSKTISILSKDVPSFALSLALFIDVLTTIINIDSVNISIVLPITLLLLLFLTKRVVFVSSALSNSKRMTGVIKEVTSIRHGRRYRYSYTDAAGKKYTQQHSLVFSDKFFKEGQKIKVAFPKNQPQNGIIADAFV